MTTVHEKVDNYRRLHENAWSKGYKLFPKIINRFNLTVGVEVGVAFGGHSEAILSTTKVTKLYGIDRYEHAESYNDPMNLTQEEFDALYLLAKDRLSKFGNRFELVRSASKEASRQIDREVDFVYLDGDHSYRGILEDLIVWTHKVKIGGVIGGHDYNSESFPGVTSAVNGWFKNEQINYEGSGCWWVRKTARREIYAPSVVLACKAGIYNVRYVARKLFRKRPRANSLCER